MTSRGLRLLAYGRVSDVRGRSGESFISPEDQMQRCRAYAEAYEHTIIEEGLDLDISGGVMTRPVLDRFLETIRDGKAQGLIVAKLDRFSRSSRGALNALAEIEAAGGVLISVQEQIDSTTAAGRFVRSIFLATAEWERERIGESWQTAKAAAVARGVHISSRIPAGYRRNGDKRLAPDGRNAETISEAFKKAAAGETYSSIANYLNERRLPSDGREIVWQSNRIRRLLANRVYLGEARSGNGHVNADAHEPLTDEPTFMLAQRHTKAPALTRGAETLLAGLCRCAGCSFAVKSQHGSKSSAAVYRCHSHTVHGRCPHPIAISMNRLDRYVVEQVYARLDQESDVVRFEGRDEDPGRQELAEAAAEAERRYQAWLTDTTMQEALGEADWRSRLLALKAAAEEALRAVPPSTAGSSFDYPARELLWSWLTETNELEKARDFLGKHIQAVFVRPAASRAHNLPIADRVRIVWTDEPELELPRRGMRFEPRAFTWEVAS